MSAKGTKENISVLSDDVIKDKCVDGKGASSSNDVYFLEK